MQPTGFPFAPDTATGYTDTREYGCQCLNSGPLEYDLYGKQRTNDAKDP